MERILPIVLTVLLLSTSAKANEGDDPKARARALLGEAVVQYDLGNFDEAIRLLNVSYASYRHSQVLFNLGQAYRQKKDFEKARFYYGSYLRNEPKTKNRALVENLIDELNERIKQDEAAAARPPSGKRQPETPVPPKEPETTAPPKEPETTAPPKKPETTAPPKKPETTAPPERPAPPTPLTRMWPGYKWLCMGLGVATATAGGLLISMDGPIKQGNRFTPEQYNTKTLGLGFTIGGAALVGTGILLWALEGSGSEGHTTHAAVLPLNGGAFFTAQGRF